MKLYLGQGLLTQGEGDGDGYACCRYPSIPLTNISIQSLSCLVVSSSHASGRWDGSRFSWQRTEAERNSGMVTGLGGHYSLSRPV